MKSILYDERVIEALTPLNIRPMKMYQGEDSPQTFPLLRTIQELSELLVLEPDGLQD